MPDERLITEIENILNQVVELGAEKERTRIVPNLLVTDASPAGLSNYITVKDDRDGDNILAVKMPDIVYNTNDFVNVLFVRGGEAIAYQKGSGDTTGGIWSIVPATSTDIFYNSGDVGIGKTVAPDARLEILDASQSQLRLTHTEDTDYVDIQVDTNGDVDITPSGDLITINSLSASEAHGTPMVNSSGAAVVVGDIGYMDEAGEFQTTTTASFFIENMMAVVEGGANTATIQVTKRGELDLNYTGSVPAQGDFLVTSTTAGKVTASSTMVPEAVAVALAAGSGGTVQARLLLNSITIDTDQTVNVFQTLAGTAPPSDFSGTIATLPDADTITYTPTGGDEDALDTNASTDSAKMVLHNTTRGNSATIDTVDTATNTINFVSAYPGDWVATDVVTLRSQTNTSNLSTAYWVDLDLQSTVSNLARAMVVEMQYGDTTAANNRGGMHPFETNAGSKRQLVRNTSTSVVQFAGQLAIPIRENKICVLWQSGGSTANFLLQLRGMRLAAP
jgi:hypothetical protein